MQLDVGEPGKASVMTYAISVVYISRANCGDSEAMIGLVLDDEERVEKLYVDPHIAGRHPHFLKRRAG